MRVLKPKREIIHKSFYKNGAIGALCGRLHSIYKPVKVTEDIEIVSCKTCVRSMQANLKNVNKTNQFPARGGAM